MGPSSGVEDASDQMTSSSASLVFGATDRTSLESGVRLAAGQVPGR